MMENNIKSHQTKSTQCQEEALSNSDSWLVRMPHKPISQNLYNENATARLLENRYLIFFQTPVAEKSKSFGR